MGKTRYFGGGSGRGGNSYRGGLLIRIKIIFLKITLGRGRGGGMGNRNGSTARPTRFGTKRSRSRSPVRQSRFDNGNDFKRPRTDNSGPTQVILIKTLSLILY
jgi:hypothetical protein